VQFKFWTYLQEYNWGKNTNICMKKGYQVFDSSFSNKIFKVFLQYLKLIS